MTIPVVLDIETAPDPAVLPLLADELAEIHAPTNYKDEAKIAAYVAEARAEFIGKLATDIDTLRIVAIGWLDLAGDSTVSLCADEAEEQTGLMMLWECARQWQDESHHAGAPHLACGFYLSTFDIPALIRRSQILGVKVPPIFRLDRYRGNVLDLADVLTFSRATARFARPLEFYARRFGLVAPDAPYSSGAEVPGWVESGDWPSIEAHLRQDLQITRQLAERIILA